MRTTGHVAGTPIDGVQIVRLDEHRDDRGSFMEVFASHWGAGIDPAQWSIVRSRPGVLRGMHLHLRHDEYLHVVSGRATVGLHDLRPDSPTRGQGAMYELDGDEPMYISFPRGLVHGWLFHEDTVHLQSVSEAYVSYGLDDNHGCHWSDPELGIPWPFEPTIVATRAQDFPTLQGLRESVEGRISPARRS